MEIPMCGSGAHVYMQLLLYIGVLPDDLELIDLCCPQQK